MRPPPLALLDHATLHPEEPWLFYPEGWDWRWLSWRDAARRMALWARAFLDDPGLPPGSRVAFAGGAHPAAVLLDLAVQAAGLVAVPLDLGSDEDPSTRLRDLRCRAWAEPEDGWSPTLPAEVKRIRLPNRRIAASEDLTFEPREGGGAVAWRDGVPLELSAADLAAWARLLEDRIGPPPLVPKKLDRDILALGGSICGWADRGMLAWATTAGAALLLEPALESEARIRAAVWARVTVCHGSAADLRFLRSCLPPERRRFWLLGPRRTAAPPRPPFGRLRTLVLAGPEPLTPGETAWWGERGVTLVDLPTVV